MASIGHVAIGLAASKLYRSRAGKHESSGASWLGWSALSLLFDADVIGFSFGVRYGDEWGHRGATHSLLFAAIVASLACFVAPWFRAPRWRTGAFVLSVVASHPLLDPLTTGGKGCALCWPFDLTRHFAPWRLIPVAPIGLSFLSIRGLQVAGIELRMFLPCFAYALWPSRRDSSYLDEL